MITAIWHMLSTGETYRELGGDYYQHHAPQHALKRKIRDLEAAGFHSHSSRASWLILTLRAGWFAAVGPFSNQSRGLLRDRESEPVSSFRLMDAEKASHSVARMADLLTVSRSGHYTCKKREHAGRSPAEQRQRQLTAIIIDFHDASDQAYGSPRILADLPDDGEQGSVKTVAKHMRSNGIVGISPRGWRPTTTVPDLRAGSIPDLGRGPPFDRRAGLRCPRGATA